VIRAATGTYAARSGLNHAPPALVRQGRDPREVYFFFELVRFAPPDFRDDPPEDLREVDDFRDAVERDFVEDFFDPPFAERLFVAVLFVEVERDLVEADFFEPVDFRDLVVEDFEDVDLPDDFFEPVLDFFDGDFFEPVLDDFFDGTLPPSRRASERPIAIACLRLVTFLPDPLRSFPRFISCIDSPTLSCDFCPYFVAMRCSPF
jgi:hypothetical protein